MDETTLRRSSRAGKRPQFYAEENQTVSSSDTTTQTKKRRRPNPIQDDRTENWRGDTVVSARIVDCVSHPGAQPLPRGIQQSGKSAGQEGSLVARDPIGPPIKIEPSQAVDMAQSRTRLNDELPGVEEVLNQEQSYGNPAKGTVIAWGHSRTRKQPTIYPVRPKTNTWAKPGNQQWQASAALAKVAKQRSCIPKLKPGQAECRLKSYKDEPPSWYYDFLERASTQRMFVLERTRDFEDDCHAHNSDCPYEVLQIAGSTGNVYTVTISHMTSCTCPVGLFAQKGDEKQCKHVLYVLHHVLKAPEHLKYQAAFLTSELQELFTDAPPLPTDAVEDKPKDGNRKPIEGDCPICFMEFEEDQNVVWCRAACGNNIHTDCFNQWAQIKARVTCPFCRAEWQSHERKSVQIAKLANVDMPSEIGAGGYRNVYHQLDYVNHGS